MAATMARQRGAARAVAAAVVLALFCAPGAAAGGKTTATLAAQRGTSQAFAARVLEGAKAQARRAPAYLEEYTVLAYPNGDVAEDRGVCTDLVVRAFRNAGLDLQRAVHEDIKAHRDSYPKIWDRKAPDRNIDHRRCPNLAMWFKRHATSLPVSLETTNHRQTWQPGDVVFYVRPKATHPWHVGIVSDTAASDGMPMIIDSFPPRTSESHRLDDFAPIHSHYRME